ncbi:right-handed parallel beta-helix repeat-containing protein [Microbacterium dauci]|uniref:Right-handed parallel beta-helix repeat-containing protein n=1 Tax=Microbacterium dauci TaxID=3048008 RepID=A0ABT6ZEB8_9MICO|nr:right-handed parallel beta-helix repeat-containing protein [Microbacterium sp. LX3-4]MDJ1114494.1 right-handed parallel beta-helix repeat-containing protein [Microbacterium sp. LX3-4]
MRYSTTTTDSTTRGKRFFARIAVTSLALATLAGFAAVSPASAAGVGPGTYENTHSALTYSGTWTTMTSSNDSAGSHASTGSPKASVSFTFEGTSVEWISRKTGSSGIDEVLIDGTKVATIDRYSATGQFQQTVFRTTSLSNGEHTITIRPSGTRNPSASGSLTIVDAFRVPDTTRVTGLAARPVADGVALSWTRVSGASGYHVYRTIGSTSKRISGSPTSGASYTDRTIAGATPASYWVRAVIGGVQAPASATVAVTSAAGPGTYQNTHQALSYEGTWSTVSSSNDSGGSHASTGSSRAAVSFTFTGSAVQWLSRKTGSSGIDDVYIDGAKVTSVDRYSATGQFQQVGWQTLTLDPGVHTIMVKPSGRRNAAASGALTIVDAFRVPEAAAPVKVTGVKATTGERAITVQWRANPERDITGYLVQRASGTSTNYSQIASLPASATSFEHIDVYGTRDYKYRVFAVDYMGRRSQTQMTVSSRIIAYAGTEYEGIDDCPTATVTVNNATTLRAALAEAGPGTVIRLEPGMYNAQFDLTRSGTRSAPIWVCGPRTAVLNGYGVGGGNGIEVLNASDVILTGFTVTNSLKAVMVTGGTRVTVSDIAATMTGQEAIHLRANTVDSIVAGNEVSNTGLVTPEYGEGIYIGSHPDNWCALTDCEPDESLRNTIADNEIFDTSAEAIDAKEGSAGGRIIGNVIDGSSSTATDRMIVIRGNDWFVADNVGDGGGTARDGILVDQPPNPGYGADNLIVRNRMTVAANGYVVRITGKRNVVGCTTNRAVGVTAPVTNITCTR